MSLVIVNVGAAKLDASNNTLSYQIKGLPGKDGQDAQDYGFAPAWCAPGDASYPGPGTQALYDDELHLILGFRNTQIAGVYGQMKPGDEAKFSTDTEHSARTFWKAATQEITSLVKTPNRKDAFQTLNGKEEKFQISIGGCTLEIGKDGVKITTPAGYIQITIGGTVYVNGAIVYLGQHPTLPVATGPGTPLNTISTSVVA